MAIQFIDIKTRELIHEEPSMFQDRALMNKLIVLNEKHYITKSFDVANCNLRIFVAPATGNDSSG